MKENNITRTVLQKGQTARALSQGRTAGEQEDINGGLRSMAGWLKGDIVHQMGLAEWRLKRMDRDGAQRHAEHSTLQDT